MIRLADGSKRLLKPCEIECRVGQRTKDGSRYSVLLYKTARTDMAVLDEVFGWQNWQSEHYQVKDKDFCRLSVRLSDGSWISKSDCGDETNVEARKGESSDAMKRAGTQFGIGRELYSAPQIWVDSSIKDRSLSVDEIQYDDNDKISYLLITGYSTTERDRAGVFTFGNGKSIGGKKDAPKSEPTPAELNEIRDIVDKLEFEGKDIDKILDFYKAEKIGDVSLELWRKMLAKVRIT